jgi:DNA-binding CsgD family transcriptional regulator
MDQRLVDRIYECSFAPEVWPGVLDGLAEIAGARGGVLLAANVANRNVLNWTTSAALRDLMNGFVTSGSFGRQKRLTRFLQYRYGGFISEAEVYPSPEDMAAEPTYAEWLWPAGLGWCAATAITLPTGDLLAVTIEREHDRGPPDAAIINQLNELRPHLARSALLSARLQLERARIASETLALIGLPALVFDETGKVLAANHLIEALTGFIRWRAGDRVALKDPTADALWCQAIATIQTDERAPVRSFAGRAADADADTPMVAHVIPIRGVVRDLFARCAGVLVLTPVTLPNAPPVELVQSLFDLTPAEAKVARSLVTGATVDEIAAGSNVSSNTVRTQVRGVLEKTGCRRQAEVIALLSGIGARQG